MFTYFLEKLIKLHVGLLRHLFDENYALGLLFDGLTILDKIGQAIELKNELLLTSTQLVDLAQIEPILILQLLQLMEINATNNAFDVIAIFLELPGTLLVVIGHNDLP